MNRSRLLLHQQTNGSSPITPMAVCVVDFDGFTAINDRFGEDAGDEVLRQAGTRLALLLDRADYWAREPGDEFTVIFSGPVRANSSCQLAREICDVLSRPYHVKGSEILASVSVGLATMHDVVCGSLLTAATHALYVAKAHGGAQVERYNHEFELSTSETVKLRAAFASALGDDRVHVEYQPIFDHDGHVIAAESVVRVTRSNGEVYGLDTFADAIAGTHLVARLDELTLERSCQMAARLQSSGRASAGARADVGIGWNASAETLRGSQLAAQVACQLDLAGVAPICLTIRSAAPSVLDCTPAMAKQLAKLHKLGVHIALDESGSGLSFLDLQKSQQTTIESAQPDAQQAWNLVA